LAKIAAELELALTKRRVSGARGGVAARVLAKGAGWRVADVLCTSGPEDMPFEESHSDVSIAMVVAGTFQYRGTTLGASSRNELMTPGSLLLGSAGQRFECGHEHGEGDRCISFWYAPDYFERIASDAGVRHARAGFNELRLPALRALSSLVANACVAMKGSGQISWEEVSLKLAGLTAQLVNGMSPRFGNSLPSAQARVTRVLRTIEKTPETHWPIEVLAKHAGLSSYHFLRTFEDVTGVTPHQYLLRTRLREAALRITEERDKILDVALDSGFGDVSNFNRAFRAEFGMSPRAYRLNPATDLRLVILEMSSRTSLLA
jgi:AraC family transcriptional regulator